MRLKLALEVDGPAHFTKNTARPLGHMVLKHRTLSKMGWTVVSVGAVLGPWVSLLMGLVTVVVVLVVGVLLLLTAAVPPPSRGDPGLVV